VSQRPQGWYRDPFGIHQDRYFSEGWPTKLVRDDGTESYDLPPDLPLPETLIPIPPDVTGAGAGPDLRRADQVAEDPDRAQRALFDYFDQLNKPG
jgi:hypothetical protein